MYPSQAAVVGTGFIGPVHVEGLLRAGVRVHGILGSSHEKSKQAAMQMGLSKSYACLEEILADRDIHVVHLASPNRLHFEQAMACIQAGKHVLCEKPLAMNSLQSTELVRAMKASGLVGGVNYNVRYYPLCIEAAQRIRSGNIGKVYHVTGSYVQDWLLHETDFNWRVLSSEGGPLRALADIGTHWLDLVQCITGLEIEAVFADLMCVHPTRYRKPNQSNNPNSGASFELADAPVLADPSLESVAIDTEDYGSVLIRFRSGARGSMHVSQVTAGRKNCLQWEIAGSQSSLAWNSQSPNQLWMGRRHEPNQEMIRDPALLSVEARRYANYPGGHNEGFPDTFKQLYRAFYTYLEHGDFSAPAPFPTFEDGHREVVLCEAILASAQKGGWVEVPGLEDKLKGSQA